MSCHNLLIDYPTSRKGRIIMKMSISLPNDVALEIKQIAKESERPVSWWIQKAWSIARSQLMVSDREKEKRRKKAAEGFRSLRGALTDLSDSEKEKMRQSPFFKNKYLKYLE